MDLVVVSVASRHLPAWLSNASSCPGPFILWCRSHTEAIEGQAAPLSTCRLRALLILASAIKTAFLFPACPPVPPAGGFTSTKESCEAEMEERLCDGVVPAVCVCLSGEGSGSLV